MGFNREQSLIMDTQENMKQRITDLENEVAILKQDRLGQQLMDHIISLRTRVTALESSAHQ